MTAREVALDTGVADGNAVAVAVAVAVTVGEGETVDAAPAGEGQIAAQKKRAEAQQMCRMKVVLGDEE